MPRHLGRSTLRRVLAVLAPAVLLAAPAAAHAESVVTDDVVGDVVSTPTDPFLIAGDEDFVASPDNVSADITRTEVDHTSRRLVVTASFRDLQDTFGDTVAMRIRTPQRSWSVYAERRGRQTVTTLLARRSDPSCRRLLTTVDTAADTVSVRVPSACIGDPRWVQVGLVFASTEVRHDPATGDVIDAHIDDAYGQGFVADGRPTFGPRVRRG